MRRVRFPVDYESVPTTLIMWRKHFLWMWKISQSKLIEIVLPKVYLTSLNTRLFMFLLLQSYAAFKCDYETSVPVVGGIFVNKHSDLICLSKKGIYSRKQ